MAECEQVLGPCAHAFKELTTHALLQTEQLAQIRDRQDETNRLLRGNGREGLETRMTRMEARGAGCKEGTDGTWKKISIGMGLVALLIAILA